MKKIGILIALLGTGIGIYAAINPMAVTEIVMKIGPENLHYYIIGFTLFILVISFGPMVNNLMKTVKTAKLLAKRGQKTRAKILNIQDTGISVNNAYYIKITVETTPGVKAEIQGLYSRINIPRVGDMIDILFDPGNPSIAGLDSTKKIQ